MNHHYLTRSLIVTGALLVGTSASAIQIDTFSDDPTQIVASQSPGLPPSSSFSSAPVEIGVTRELTVAAGTGDLGSLGLAGGGLLQFSNSPTSAGILTAYYDIFLSPVDLTDSGSSNGFLFTVEFADELVDYRIGATGGPAAGQSSGTLPTGITGSGDTQEIFVPFSSFITTGGSGSVDFSAAQALYIEFRPNNDFKGADLVISNFRTGVVPEPSSLALLALGGLAMMRRRRSA